MKNDELLKQIYHQQNILERGAEKTAKTLLCLSEVLSNVNSFSTLKTEQALELSRLENQLRIYVEKIREIEKHLAISRGNLEATKLKFYHKNYKSN